MSKIGIYLIAGPMEQKYIGQSINIPERWRNHRKELRSNRHRNSKLQNAWNKHGESNFYFSVLLYCEANDLELYEQKLLDIHQAATHGYNIAPSATSTRGIKNPSVADRNRRQRGSLHPSFGKPRPDLSARNRAGSPMKGRKVMNPYAGRRSLRGKDHWNFGRIHARRGKEIGPRKLLSLASAISDLLKSGESVSALARQFNVKWETMNRMKRFITAGVMK